ncbi:MAG: hypothetical protein Q9195_002512 [Heterodermia aff. obscurata]
MAGSAFNGNMSADMRSLAKQAEKDRVIDYYSDYDDDDEPVLPHDITQKPVHMGKYLVEYAGVEDNNNGM